MTEMCIILLKIGALWDTKLVYYGICAAGAGLWEIDGPWAPGPTTLSDYVLVTFAAKSMWNVRIIPNTKENYILLWWNGNRELENKNIEDIVNKIWNILLGIWQVTYNDRNTIFIRSLAHQYN